jgi:hypothetical protein
MLMLPAACEGNGERRRSASVKNGDFSIHIAHRVRWIPPVQPRAGEALDHLRFHLGANQRAKREIRRDRPTVIHPAEVQLNRPALTGPGRMRCPDPDAAAIGRDVHLTRRRAAGDESHRLAILLIKREGDGRKILRQRRRNAGGALSIPGIGPRIRLIQRISLVQPRDQVQGSIIAAGIKMPSLLAAGRKHTLRAAGVYGSGDQVKRGHANPIKCRALTNE